MNPSSNKYTLILIKDYANLNQIKLSPTSFWTFVSFALLFCIISIFSMIVALFLWFTSKNILIEHKELQQKYAQAQISLERLLVLKKITNQNNALNNISPEMNSETLPQEKRVNTKSEINAKEQKKKIEKKLPLLGKRNFKQKVLISSKIFSITQAKIISSQDTLLLEARLNNNIGKQKSGTLLYYITTKNGKRYNIPAQRKARTYSFVSYKTIMTELPYPSKIDGNSVASLGIEVIENSTVLYRIEFIFQE
ncbi:MAG: hypothetical protein ACRCV3_02455 [Desulfovibrionaceae bacterium]